MAVVLVLAGAFVYWRVEFALNRQLDQDLDAYHAVVDPDLSAGETPPAETPGQSYQVYDRRGRVIGGDAPTRLVDVETVTSRTPASPSARTWAACSRPRHRPYRVITSPVRTLRAWWSSPRPSADTSTTRPCASCCSSWPSRTWPR